jgi:hypothetical protein
MDLGLGLDIHHNYRLGKCDFSNKTGLLEWKLSRAINGYEIQS